MLLNCICRKMVMLITAVPFFLELWDTQFEVRERKGTRIRLLQCTITFHPTSSITMTVVITFPWERSQMWVLRVILCAPFWNHPVAVWLVALALCWQVARWDVVQPARRVRVESVDTRGGIPGKEHKILLPLVLSPTRSLFLCLHRKVKGREENYKTKRLWLYIWMALENCAEGRGGL